MRASLREILWPACSRHFSPTQIEFQFLFPPQLVHISYLAVRPSDEAMLSANLLQAGRAYAEGLAGFGDWQVKKTRQDVHAGVRLPLGLQFQKNVGQQLKKDPRASLPLAPAVQLCAL